MNDLQAKFAISLVAFGLFFAYAVPSVKQARDNQAGVINEVGRVYIAPNPDDPHAPSGFVSVDELQKYSARKAAERRALGLQ